MITWLGRTYSALRDRKARLRTVVVGLFMLLLVTASVVAISLAIRSSTTDVELSIAAELAPREQIGVASVDIGAAVGGDWNRLLVWCGPTASDEIERELGFAWGQSGDFDRVGEQYLMVFANDNAVERFFVQRDSTWYFSPCRLDRSGDQEFSQVPRSSSVMGFTLDARTGTWSRE